MNMLRKLRHRVRAFRASLQHRRDAKRHPARHAALYAQLQAQPAPGNILVLCHANICRSPYFEAALRKALPGIEIRSAGFMGGGRSVPEHSHTVARSRGLDLSAHRSRVVTHALLADADLVIVMEPRQAEALQQGFRIPPNRIVIAGDLDPEAGHPRPIQDPWRQSLAAFESSFSRLDRCAASLAMILKGADEE